MNAQELRTLSDLLDRAFEMPEGVRETWLAGLGADAQPLVPILRQLLTRQAHRNTADLLRELPPFTAPHDGAPAPSEFAPGALVGPYRLEHELGRGGMGEVWLAERDDGQLRRRVALKLPMLRARRSVLAQRFARERDILSALAHPNIARLYDAGVTDDGQPYLALEWVEGEPIDAHCRTHELSVEARLALVLQVARAVAYAHAQLVIHRDLKPSNILVTADGEVRLLDFGIAKLIGAEGGEAPETQLTQASGRVLTPDYASPEQVTGQAIGTASDVYSLAVVTYELLTGRRPYRLRRDSAAALEQAIVDADTLIASAAVDAAPLRRRLRGDLDAILQRALLPAPAARYASVEAFAADIERHLAGRPVAARPDRLGYRLRKFVARNRIGVAAAAAVMLAVLAGAAVALWQAQVAARQADRAEQVKDFLVELFRSADPDAGSGRGTTTTALLLGSRSRIETRFAERPDVAVEVLSAVGYSLIGLSETEAALPFFNSAIALADRHLDEDDNDALFSHLRMGEALLALDRVEQARPHLARALAGFRRNGNDVGAVIALRWTSRMHTRLRERDAAVQAATEASQMARARLGPESRVTALEAEIELLTALQVASRAGQLEPARRALELAQAIHGGQIVRRVLTAREALGTAMIDEGDPATGVALLQSALDDARGLFGPRHAMVGYFAGRLYRGQVVKGDVQAATATARFARETWDEVHGDKLRSDRGFGRLYEGMSLIAAHRFAQAIAPLEGAVELFEGIQSRPLAAAARAGLAAARMQAGDLDGAEAALGSVPARVESYEAAALALRAGMLRRLQGRPDEALAHLQAAHTVFESRLSDRYALAGVRVALADAFLDLAQTARARPLIEQALTVYRQLQPAMSPVQAEAWTVLARAQLQANQAAQAQDSATRALAFWQAYDGKALAAGRALAVEAQARRALGDAVGARQAWDQARRILDGSRLTSDRQLLEPATPAPALR